MKQYLISDYGVISSAELVQTEAIQRVIDRCFHEDGGEVVFPAGTYLTGGLVLKSNVTIRLLSGCLIKGTRDPVFRG